MRWFCLCGMIPLVLDAVVVGIVSDAQPDYDPIRDYLSVLTAPDHPDRAFLRAWWTSFGFQFAPFAAAVYAGTRSDRHRWVVPVLLLVFAFFISLCGVFPCDPGCRGRTVSAKVHFAVSGVAALALAPCPLTFWWTTRHDARWHGFRWFSWVIQIAGTAAIASLGLAYLHWFPLAGLCERIFWGLYCLWILVIAIQLFRLEGAQR